MYRSNDSPATYLWRIEKWMGRKDEWIEEGLLEEWTKIWGENKICPIFSKLRFFLPSNDVIFRWGYQIKMKPKAHKLGLSLSISRSVTLSFLSLTRLVMHLLLCSCSLALQHKIVEKENPQKRRKTHKVDKGEEGRKKNQRWGR